MNLPEHILDLELIASEAPSITPQERVYQVIRKSVVSGALKPGMWLRQMQLAKELDVSQGTVRHALNRLAAEGLLVAEPYKGFRLAIITPEYQLSVGKVLCALEQLAFELAIPLITPQDLDEMRALLPLVKIEQKPEDVSRQFNIEYQFHFIVHRASGNPVLIKMIKQLWDRYHISEMNYYNEKEWKVLASIENKYNAKLIQVLEDGDVEKARQMVYEYWHKDFELDASVFQRIFGK